MPIQQQYGFEECRCNKEAIYNWMSFWSSTITRDQRGHRAYLAGYRKRVPQDTQFTQTIDNQPQGSGGNQPVLYPVDRQAPSDGNQPGFGPGMADHEAFVEAKKNIR